ncbi:MAG: MFS transporter [Halanaerobiales bacterium]|nr:MFS transporter [Halanaerobiales bacterium]
MYFKVFNFIYYMTMASKSFFNIHFSNLGYTSTQIGLINSIARGVALLILPFWGMAADSLQANKKILQLAVVGAMIFSIMFLATSNLVIIIILMVLLALFLNPIRPLYDNLLFSYLGDQGNRYGRYRLWGSIGYTLLVPLLGFFFENTNVSNTFYVISFLLFITLLISFKLPKNKVQQSIEENNNNKKRFANIGDLFKNKLFVVFLIYVFFMQITMNGNLTYFPLYVLEYGGKEGLFGLTKMVGSISEILILIFSDKILDRFKIKHIFAVSSSAFVIRWILLGLFPMKSIFLGSQVLHSLSFGLFYVTCVNFINKVTKDEVKATAQNVFTSVYIGLGSIFGNMVGGVIFDKLGGHIMYLTWSALAFTAGIGYYIFLSKTEKRVV